MRVCAPRPVPSSAHPLVRLRRHPRTTTHSQRTTSPEPGGLASSSSPSPTPGSAEETRGARGPRRERPRPASGRGRDGAYLPWASRMAACDSAGTWPPPPSPGLETWRAGTKMAAPPNFHCYFGHSSSYFLGTRLPPCDGSGGNGTGTRLRHGGGRAEGERGSEGREGRVKGMGEETEKGGGRKGRGEGRRGDGEEEKGEKRGSRRARRGRGGGKEPGGGGVEGAPGGVQAERGLRRPRRLPRAEPAGTSAVRRPPASPGWRRRRRRAVGGG